MNYKKTAGIILLVFLFFAGGAGGYFYFSKVLQKENSTAEGVGVASKSEDLFSLRMYYPIGTQLQIEERKLPRIIGQLPIAEATAEEYLKGPISSASSHIPKNSKLIGLYKGIDKIVYVNVSDEFRRNFQGDVFAEFLLLKGLYESLISNVEDIQDVKILIEGKEVETLGGHLYLLYPLKDLVSYEYQ